MNYHRRHLVILALFLATLANFWVAWGAYSKHQLLDMTVMQMHQNQHNLLESITALRDLQRELLKSMQHLENSHDSIAATQHTMSLFLEGLAEFQGVSLEDVQSQATEASQRRTSGGQLRSGRPPRPRLQNPIDRFLDIHG